MDRAVRPAFIVAGGLVLGAVGFGLLTQIGTDSLALVVLGWGIMSLGFGATFTLTADLVVGTAPAERAGAASALSETGAEFGGALASPFWARSELRFTAAAWLLICLPVSLLKRPKRPRKHSAAQ